MADKLEERHLANLHALAAELGVPRFRLLRRDQLVQEIEARREAGQPEAAEPEAGESEAGESEPEREPAPDRERESLEQVETAEVTGTLEITPQRYGFLRLGGGGGGPPRGSC